MVFDVDPMSLGIIPRSHQRLPFAAREMAQASKTVHDRTCHPADAEVLCTIFNTILHRICGQDDMRFLFAGMEEQDKAAQVDCSSSRSSPAFICIDEARDELSLTPWGLRDPGPDVFTPMGPMPLYQVIRRSWRSRQPGSSASRRPVGVGGRGGAEHQPRAVHHPPSSRPVGTHNPAPGPPAGAGMRTGVPAAAGRGVRHARRTPPPAGTRAAAKAVAGGAVGASPGTCARAGTSPPGSPAPARRRHRRRRGGPDEGHRIDAAVREGCEDRARPARRTSGPMRPSRPRSSSGPAGSMTSGCRRRTGTGSGPRSPGRRGRPRR